MLFIGMGTEVVVFTLSAFDRPFDKTEVGKELPHDYETDEEIAARLGLTDDEEDEEEENEAEDLDNATPTVQPQVAGCVPPASPTIIIGGNGASASASAANAAATANVAAVDPVEAARAAIAAGTPEGSEPFENEAKRLAAIIRAAIEATATDNTDRQIIQALAIGLTVRAIAYALGMSKSAVQRRINSIRSRYRAIA